MITVNAMGDNCPIPVIKTKKAMAALTGPETIEVLVDNEIAVQNVTKMASSSGGKVTSEKLGMPNIKLRLKWKEHRQQMELKQYVRRMQETIQLLSFLLTVWDLEMMN